MTFSFLPHTFFSLTLLYLTISQYQVNSLSISEIWQSTHDKSRWYQNVTQLYSENLNFSNKSNVFPNIFPTPAQQLQPILGMGVGITDSVALTLEKVRNSNESQYWETLNLLFNQKDDWRSKGGSALNIVRSPLGSSDFSIDEYTFDDTYDNSPDLNFTLFTIERAPKLFNLLLDIKQVNPNVKNFFAPWSAPSWMKINSSNNRTHGGQINPIYYDHYSTYLVKSMKAIKERGLNPYMLSLQNEPLFEPEYSGTLILPEISAIIGEKVRKGLDEVGLQEVGLTAYDHNWDEPQYPITVFNLTSPGTFSSTSWHCYAGSPSGQEPFLLAFPTIPQFFSECTRITQFQSEPYSNLKQNSVQLLTGSLNFGSRGISLWNLILEVDQNGFTNPHLNGVCNNCLAPLQVRSNSQDENGNFEIEKTSDYVFLAHASLASRKFDSPTPSESSSDDDESVRKEKTNQDEYYLTAKKIGVASLDPNLVTQAFEARNEKGCSRFSLTIFNQNDRYETGVFLNSTANIFFRGETASLDLPVGLTTLSWYAPTSFFSTSECGPSESEKDAYKTVKDLENSEMIKEEFSSEYVEGVGNEFEAPGQMPLM